MYTDINNVNGFSYLRWQKITTFDTEDEAKQKCIDIIPQNDE